MAVGEAQGGHGSRFRIEAREGFPEPRTRVLKHDETFAVLNDFGNMVADRGCTHGLYHRDTRYLSRLDLRLNGDYPLPLSSFSAEDGLMHPVDLTNSDTRDADDRPLHRELIYMNRRQFVWRSGFHELLLVRNYDLTRRVITLAIGFAADFADIFEVRGQSRARHGRHTADLVGPNAVTLRYVGLDKVERTTSVCFSPVPAELTTSGATFSLELGPGEWRRVAMRILCDRGDAEDWNVTQFYRVLRAERREFRAARVRAASLEGSNSTLNELTERAAADIYLLNTDTEYGPYPFAGIPWYSTPFGRDGIITAMMTLWLDPTIAKGVLRFLAATQATAADDAKDAKPGKILHEMRNGEMARLGEVPFGRYYGSVDATPLFVMLLGEYFARTGDLELVRTLWPNAVAALHWIDNDGDPDRDGFVEYERYSGTGLINQGWKDSADSIVHADGELAPGPIALCEVQGYVYAAKRHAAVLATALGYPRSAARLEAEAETLRQRFEDTFWCEELSTYALALDGNKRQCSVVASNAGHILFTGIAAPDRAARVADTLMRVASFSGWGIRTLARTAVRFNPISYHNGSVWPHDNALIALGFARYGLKDPVIRIFRGLFDAVSYWEPRRLPELFCGFARRNTAPVMYPVACSPQAWASASVFALIQASLGLQFDPAAGEIRLMKPMLPEFLQQLHVRGLQLGDGWVNVMLRCLDGNVATTVTRRQGAGVRVVVVN